MIDSILLGFVCGALSFLWCGPLTKPGMLGNIVPVLYWELLGEYKEWKKYISKPLFECAVCHSFWISLFAVCFDEPPKSFMLSLVVVVAALFSAFYLTKKYD